MIAINACKLIGKNSTYVLKAIEKYIEIFSLPSMNILLLVLLLLVPSKRSSLALACLYYSWLFSSVES